MVDEEEGALLRRRPEAEVLPELAGVVTAEAGAEEAAGADSVAAAAEAALEGAATSEGAEADATSELDGSTAAAMVSGGDPDDGGSTGTAVTGTTDWEAGGTGALLVREAARPEALERVLERGCAMTGDRKGGVGRRTVLDQASTIR